MSIRDYLNFSKKRRNQNINLDTLNWFNTTNEEMLKNIKEIFEGVYFVKTVPKVSDLESGWINVDIDFQNAQRRRNFKNTDKLLQNFWLKRPDLTDQIITVGKNKVSAAYTCNEPISEYEINLSNEMAILINKVKSDNISETKIYIHLIRLGYFKNKKIYYTESNIFNQQEEFWEIKSCYGNQKRIIQNIDFVGFNYDYNIQPQLKFTLVNSINNIFMLSDAITKVGDNVLFSDLKKVTLYMEMLNPTLKNRKPEKKESRLKFKIK